MTTRTWPSRILIYPDRGVEGHGWDTDSCRTGYAQLVCAQCHVTITFLNKEMKSVGLFFPAGQQIRRYHGGECNQEDPQRRRLQEWKQTVTGFKMGSTVILNTSYGQASTLRPARPAPTVTCPTPKSASTGPDHRVMSPLADFGARAVSYRERRVAEGTGRAIQERTTNSSDPLRDRDRGEAL